MILFHYYPSNLPFLAHILPNLYSRCTSRDGDRNDAIDVLKFNYVMVKLMI